MDIEAALMEKIKRFEDVKNQIAEIGKQMGGLQEQQRALYNKGLELKGQIDQLLEIKADAEKKPALVLPDKALVGPDGKTVIAETPTAPVASGLAVEAPTPEAAKQPAILEVK